MSIASGYRLLWGYLYSSYMGCLVLTSEYNIRCYVINVLAWCLYMVQRKRCFAMVALYLLETLLWRMFSPSTFPRYSETRVQGGKSIRRMYSRPPFRGSFSRHSRPSSSLRHNQLSLIIPCPTLRFGCSYFCRHLSMAKVANCIPCLILIRIRYSYIEHKFSLLNTCIEHSNRH